MRRLIHVLLVALLVAGGNAFAATTVNSPLITAAPQPAFTDLSGSAACGQLPALTGNVTTSVGTCATTLATVPSGLTYPAPTVTGSFTATGLVTNADLANSTITLGSSTLTLGGTTTSVGGLTLTSPTVTGAFTATGLVTNADLANSATTVNGQTCTLGSTCTVTASGITQASKTTAYSVLSTDNGTYFDNTGASASVTFTLPTSPATAQNNCFFAVAAQPVVILAPASTKIYYGTTASATAGNITASTAVGNTACVYAVNSTTWMVKSAEGTWTVN